MSQAEPVLHLASALPFFEMSALPNAPLDLTLMPGDCALIETADPARATALAELCSGMAALRRGQVRFLGYDWTTLARDRAAALRGRIGRVHQRGAWIDTLGTHVNIMLARLHHTRESEPAIARAATDLARQLGLPGLPLARPDQLSDGDLLRAGCVRAFLGEPRLLLLDGAVSADHEELAAPVLRLLSRTLDRGAAAICFTRDAAAWHTRAFPLTHRLHLLEAGLQPARRV
jgi:phospholipid/cholesterol/gamma-HCH transport system ATP-binding protein